MNIKTLDLGRPWEFMEFPESARRMRDLDAGQWTPTQTPHSIFAALIDAGCMSRLELDANPEDFAWVSERAWVFRKQFTVEHRFFDQRTVWLVFEGLDTVTQLWLNDKLIGRTDNMFIPHRFEVGDRLLPGVNTLTVKFISPVEHAGRLMQRYGKMSDYHYGDPRRSYLRKAQYQFGSVLGPALPGCGIFRPVRLESWTTARLEDVHTRTVDCNQHYADLRAAVTVHRAAGRENEPLTAHLTLTGGGLRLEQPLHFAPGEVRNTTVLRIDRPIFWQPSGSGVPHLYHLTADLCRPNGDCLDRRETDVGIRRIRVHRSSDRRGQSFGFEVNDTPVYIKGANWVPLSMLPGSHSAEDYERLLTALQKAHINMLRVWGGGYYEDDLFYRLCDRLGILVWQDFAFASAYYPDRQWFLEKVETEARSVIKRLGNFACLALWCGNSRIDHLHASGRLGDGRKFYGRAIYHERLPNLLGELDPDRDYVPTTPFGDSGAKDLNSPADGTCHHWEVWNNFAATREYLFDPLEMPRFLAEFGLQSLPDLTCVRRMCPSRRLSIASDAIEKHIYQADGDGRMARYCAELFRPPRTLAEQIDQTQLTQARAVKLCVEHLRANTPLNSGVLLWTANDCACAAGFSAIDSGGHRKALYYYARRFFAPRLITLELDKEAYLKPHLKGRGIVVVNDSPGPLTATVRCRCVDFQGQVLDAMEYPVAIGPFSKSPPRMLPRTLACPQTPNRSLLHLEAADETGTIAENRFYYLPDKYIHWPAASVDVDVRPAGSDGWTVLLTASGFLRDVCVVPPAEAVLSDNYIDLHPGQTQEIDIQFAGQAPPPRIPVCLRSVPGGIV